MQPLDVRGSARVVAAGLALGVGALGCQRPNPLFDPGQDAAAPSTSRGATSGTGDGLGATSHVPDDASASDVQDGSSVDPVDPETADGSSVTGGSLGGSTGPGAECSPSRVALDAYPPCPDARCDDGVCYEHTTAAPVVFATSVCASTCETSCDCPAAVEGSTIPTCIDGACGLSCGRGDCPAPMACIGGRCVWSHAYLPCDGGCFGGCISTAGGAAMCAQTDCLADGVPDSSLCPPPPDGDATPICFEPAKFPGVGWCALDCLAGQVCPTAMFCDSGGLCLFEP